ncbi:MAG: hypothetical protein A2945_03065 [Candidatus Liptonbacteria bacterium RIFCSPLOWO2_01_FULL_52_25]|uniref:Uncharacterized protein n=1 Tax=Candidatus Liptonbacteria bacterium RIFCSPLOWO2_01_FULL_52_25 TaxID=1798650 RepID=A0A1G2CE35_9BACT|nr:MAG: hypothetical protein A2945_03065 [Candidatus Liptonbacteria bacterium RIFCSPLOWO2_01_FULL_52_25]
MKIVEDTISLQELREIAEEFYTTMVKGVVDIEKKIVAFGGEYHADANAVMIENGSLQSDVWGFNVYFDRPRESRIEYVSLINIRPQAGSTEMEVQNKDVRNAMEAIINSTIE